MLKKNRELSSPKKKIWMRHFLMWEVLNEIQMLSIGKTQKSYWPCEFCCQRNTGKVESYRRAWLWEVTFPWLTSPDLMSSPNSTALYMGPCREGAAGLLKCLWAPSGAMLSPRFRRRSYMGGEAVVLDLCPGSVGHWFLCASGFSAQLHRYGWNAHSWSLAPLPGKPLSFPSLTLTR